MNADVQQIVVEFALTDNPSADDTLTSSLRGASQAWHAAVVAAVRFRGPIRSGPITTLRALLCPDLVIEVALPSVRSLCRAAVLWSPRGCLDLTPFTKLALKTRPRSMLPRVWDFADAERIGRVVFPSGPTLLKKGFRSLTLDTVVLPPTVTQIGNACFASSRINACDFALCDLHVAGIRSFYRFHTQTLDLSAATTLTVLPNSCFRAAEMARLKLPANITKIGASCFMNAKIAEFNFPPSRLRTLGMLSFNEFQTPRLDLSAASDVTALPEGCFQHAQIERLFLPKNVTTLGTSCFMFARLPEIDLPAGGLHEVGAYCFSGLHTQSPLNFSMASNLTSLPQSCFARADLKQLTLPGCITQLDEACFQEAKIPELCILASDHLCVVKVLCFAQFQTRSLDLRAATHLVELPSSCFFSANIDQLFLPATISKFDNFCFNRANIYTFFFSA